MPADSPEALLRRALDQALALTPPHYGMDRRAYVSRLHELAAGIESLRKAVKAKDRKDLPEISGVNQLVDLSGKDFTRQREEIVAELQALAEKLMARMRSAPPELIEALRAVGGEASAALERDAHEAWRSFHSGAYKAAVVMAGATLEGLIQEACARLPQAAAIHARLFAGRAGDKQPRSFTVDEGLSVLREAGKLTSAITHVGRGLKEMRNLVHPDVQRRQRAPISASHATLALQALCTLAEELARA
ncbi:MAG: hypothetical protein IT462_02400 [Planctomycetes bacterium]|nr:hypothetical protein [Planctomycetota bacterium]